MDIILESLSDSALRDIVDMVKSGDAEGIRTWADTLKVQPRQLAESARSLVIRTKMSEDQREDEIRRRANQTQFARASRGEQQRGEPWREGPMRGEFRREEPYRGREWRDGRRGPEFNPFAAVVDMERRMMPGYGYQQSYGYYPAQQGSYGFVDQSPLDGDDDDDDAMTTQPAAQATQPAAQAQQPAAASQPAPVQKAEPAQQAEPDYKPGPGAISFKLPGDKPAVYQPTPNAADMAMVKRANAPTQKVNVGGPGKQIDAYVYDYNGVTYVIAAAGH